MKHIHGQCIIESLDADLLAFLTEIMNMAKEYEEDKDETEVKDS